MALSRWTSNLEDVKPTAILKGFYHVDAASNLVFFGRDFKLLLLLNESKQQGGVFPIDASCNLQHVPFASWITHAMSQIKCSICSYPEAVVSQAKVAFLDFVFEHVYGIFSVVARPKLNNS